MKPLYFFLLLSIMYSCSEPIVDDEIPLSYGYEYEMGLIISPEWSSDSLGVKIKRSLAKDFQGVSKRLPQFQFYERFDGMTDRSRRQHMLFYVLDLQDTSESAMKHQVLLAEEISQCDSFPCLFVTDDKWAQGQRVIGLAGNNKRSVQDYFIHQEDTITALLEEEVLAAYSRNIARTEEMTSHQLSGESAVLINGPKEFATVAKAPNYTWLRLIGEETEQSIFSIEFDVPERLPKNDSTFAVFRDSLIASNIGSEFDLARIRTEKRMPVKLKRTNDNNIFVLEAVGLWKMEDNPELGGSFISVIIPAQNDKALYLEGFVFAPGDMEPELIRKMKLIINSAN